MLLEKIMVPPLHVDFFTKGSADAGLGELKLNMNDHSGICGGPRVIATTITGALRLSFAGKVTTTAAAGALKMRTALDTTFYLVPGDYADPTSPTLAPPG